MLQKAESKSLFTEFIISENNMCKVSVLIPAYNTERYIERCIGSVLNQTLKDIEIIIINDGSTDGTKLILDKLQGSDSRLKIYHQENKGIGASRKKALEFAKGKYFQFIDSDDWIDSDFLATMYSIAEKYNADIVEAGGFYYHDKNGKLKWEIKNSYQSEDIVEIQSKDIAKKIVQRQHSCSLCTKLFRKEFCTKNNIDFVNSIDFGEDAHFICRVCYHNPKYIHTKKIFYHYMSNPTSTTKTRYTQKKFNCRIRWINDLELYYNDLDFTKALWSMKFFIKEEATISCLFNQSEYLQIFPNVMLNLKYVNVNPLRKLLVRLAVKHDNIKIGTFANKSFVKFIMRASNYIGRRTKLFQ
jgi:glycosyltransferase involved in cell wall biosynthesis